jgi:hypothetical protein
MHELFDRTRVVAMAGFAVIAVSVAGCGGGGGSTPVFSPAQTSGGSGFTATQSQTLVSGGTPIPVPLPTSSGYGGTVTLPIPAATIPAHTTLSETLTNTAASAARFPQFTAPQSGGTFLLYLELEFSSNVGFPLPSLLVNVPWSDIVPDAAYYLAFYDPNPNTYEGWSTGWQYGVEGPVYPYGNTLYFSGPQIYPYDEYPYPFTANQPVYFGLYEVGGALPTPSPSPSGTPEAPFYLDPSTLQVNGLGYASESQSSIEDESGCECSYSVTSSDTNIASAWTDGKNVYVVGNATGFAGITVAASDGRTAILNVTVTQTNVSIQGSHRR